jgi:hypothetical protein
MKEYKNESGQYHREDGPALENDYIKIWYINGNKHREDGHAVEYSDGYKRWYLNDINYTEEEYHQELIKLKLKRLKNL